MASLTIAEVASASTFMGASLKGAVAPSQARVTMAWSAQDLKSKPLSLLRILAIQRGVKGAPRTKDEIVAALLGVSSGYSAPSRSAASSSGNSHYDSMTLGQLRVLAKERGLRGDTKKELIQLLTLSGGAPAAPSYSSAPASTPSYSSAPAATSSSSLPAAVLERKSLSELRAMARIRGIRGDTKKELVKLLSAGASSSPASSPAPSSNGAAYPAATSYSAPPASVNHSAVLRSLQMKSISQLRAMANVKGVRGTTKEQLVRELAAVMA